MQRRQGVKNQRRVNSQQPPAARDVSKKKPQKENAPKQQTAPVGVSGVPLSARFSTLQKQAIVEHQVPASKKNVVVNVKKTALKKTVAVKKNAKQQLKVQEQQKQQQQKQKMQKVALASKTKRQETVNKRRKGLEVAPAVNGAKKNKANGAASALKPKKKGLKVKIEKKKPVTGEDLDVEMDTYWHEAGKGPDPQQALLDRQMEEYWAGKPKRDGEAAPETTTA